MAVLFWVDMVVPRIIEINVPGLAAKSLVNSPRQGKRQEIRSVSHPQRHGRPSSGKKQTGFKPKKEAKKNRGASISQGRDKLSKSRSRPRVPRKHARRRSEFNAFVYGVGATATTHTNGEGGATQIPERQRRFSGFDKTTSLPCWTIRTPCVGGLGGVCGSMERRAVVM